MKKNYRWGILGAGRIAEKFCTALCFVEGSEVYAVASRDVEKAKAYGLKFGATKVYDNYDDLVKDENVDIIYIATPHAFHFEQAMRCLNHKKAVLCEKPMTLGVDQTTELISTALFNNVFLMEGMWTACMPILSHIRKLLDENIIGPPQYLTADFGFTAEVDLESRLYNKTLGGGAMMDVGVYPLFLATSLFGTPTLIKTISKLSVTGIDEYTSTILQYPGGETAHLLAAINFNTAIEAEIIGTKGRIKIKNPWFKATAFTVCLNDGTTQEYVIPHFKNGFEHEILEVMHCLDNGLLESGKVPHSLSLAVSKISQEILLQAGVVYQ